MTAKPVSLAAATAILFVVDRLAKIWFLKNPGAGWDFIKGWLGFSLARNQGIAFGIPFHPVLLLVVLAAALFFLIWAWLRACRQHDNLLTFGLHLIIVGAVSNLIDRLRYGAVIDYIDVPFFTIFNLADVMISGGVLLLVLAMLWSKQRTGGVVTASRQK